MTDSAHETDAVLNRLSELNRLRKEGAISEAEFEKLKASVLAGGTPPSQGSPPPGAPPSRPRRAAPMPRTLGLPGAVSNVSVREALNSELLTQALVTNADYYRSKWLAMAEKHQILDLPINDPAVFKKRYISWNWPAFFATFYWAIYRRINYAWLALGVFLVAAVVTNPWPAFDRFFYAGTAGLSVVMGLQGNSMLLGSYLKNFAQGTLNPESHKSWRDLFLALGALVLAAIAAVILEIALES